MSWTSSVARACGGRVEPLGRGAKLLGAVAVEDDLLGPGADGGQVAKPGGAERKAEVEHLGAAAAAGALGFVAGLLGGAFDARLLLRRERLAGGPLGVGSSVLGGLQQGAPGGAAARRHELERGGAQLAARAREQEPRPHDVAAGEPCGGGHLLPVAIALKRGLHRLDRQGGELDRLAARGNRLEEALGLGAEQDQVGEAGRLLERLQQGVLALVAHRLGRLEDEDPALPFEGPVGGGTDHPLAYGLDHVLGPGRRKPDQVGVGRGVESGAAPGVVGVLGARGEDLGGEGPGGGALARPARAPEEIRVRGARLERRREDEPHPRLVLGRRVEDGHGYRPPRRREVAVVPAYREEVRPRVIGRGPGRPR